MAKANDIYFCTVPGHRAAGMEGRIEVSDGATRSAEGVTADGQRQTARSRISRSGTLENWTSTGDAFAVVERTRGCRNRRSVSGHAGAYWVSSGGRQRAIGARSRPRRSAVSAALRQFPRSPAAPSQARAWSWCSADDNKVIYTISGADHDTAAASGRRSVWLRRHGHLRAAGGRRDGGADGGLSQGEPVGAHQLRQLPVPRVEAVLPQRNHADGDERRCRRWIRSRTRACRPEAAAAP